MLLELTRLQDLENFFSLEKSAFICLSSLLVRKEKVYDEIKLSISDLLLKQVSLKHIENEMSTVEQEYFTKCLVVALNSNENPFIKQNLTQLIANLLLPMWAQKEETEENMAEKEPKCEEEEKE